MTEFHEGICGGNYSWRATAHKILKAGFYWPKLFGDVFTWVRACDKCQKFAERQKLAAQMDPDCHRLFYNMGGSRTCTKCYKYSDNQIHGGEHHIRIWVSC